MRKKRRSKIEVEKIIRYVNVKEQIGLDEYPIAAEYVNFCLLSRNGMVVRDVFIDARIGNRL